MTLTPRGLRSSAAASAGCEQGRPRRLDIDVAEQAEVVLDLDRWVGGGSRLVAGGVLRAKRLIRGLDKIQAFLL